MFNKKQLLSEIEIQTALSGGPGGQHVNKTETKVIISWDFLNSQAVNQDQKKRLSKVLSSHINNAKLIKVSSAKTRSQHKNKADAIVKLEQLVDKALKIPKKRKKTKPSKLAKLKRLKAKQKQSEKKNFRQKPKLQ
ncbi:alternative ribosome rescue aminoacyl-tRNA hydrolase ArfB [Psychroflexus sp. ALD_RP9]|uniref:alternative ribosome rescue aminoacyl-tRNA hydrolase ArfB n=1 Tax=Psychroflexus sp. ALD_RP9 TaxID=2777186 RepID=UPI001A8D8A08|nr:alternative ribosome rescue aminoacyl-tRNA hydrolase ArfB [Psychroflexus sp. ALD_RP9]QSS96104.1 aminoacyl-tRNA hydrolase [Psychroflexus sp. ALD_RP9]